MKKNAIVGQSGGPTAVINASLYGVIKEGINQEAIDHVYGMINGIEGYMSGTCMDLTADLTSDELELLKLTPAAYLGSCRYKLPEDLSSPFYPALFEKFRKMNIGYFFYIGGNDSMDTVHKLSDYIRKNNIQGLSVMGAPKTIDNDLPVTDHCPGFGSAAKDIAATFSEIVRDCEVYDIPAVPIVAGMGRNAGWLTAASALSRENGGTGPQLIYLCERAFDTERFLQDIQDCLKKRNAVVVAVSEGVKNPDGSYLSESKGRGVDVFGHAALSGTAKVLEGLVKERIGCKVRSIELNLMQRCASHLASANDLRESRMLGMTAADRAISGISGQMAVVLRDSDEPYRVHYSTVDIAEVANLEKKVPDNWINAGGNDVTEEMLSYLRPLVRGEVSVLMNNGVPVHLNLYSEGK